MENDVSAPAGRAARPQRQEKKTTTRRAMATFPVQDDECWNSGVNPSLLKNSALAASCLRLDADGVIFLISGAWDFRFASKTACPAYNGAILYLQVFLRP
jgi:hypothetical protein